MVKYNKGLKHWRVMGSPSLDIKQYKRIFDETGYPVFIVKDYRFIYANQAFAKLIGKKNLSKKCSEIFNCAEEGSPGCEIQQVIQTNKSYKTTVPLPNKNKELWYNLEVSPLRDKEGNIEAFLFTGRDISSFVGLERQIIKKNSGLRAINKIAMSLTQLDLDSLLESVLKNINKTLSVQKLAVHLLEGNELRLKAYFGLSEDFLKFANSHKKNEDNPVSMCAKKKEAIYLDDVKKSPDPIALKYMTREGIQSHASVPLLANGRLVGVIAGAKMVKNGFSSDELNVLGTVAGQIAVAIENARLYERTTELSRTDLLTGLFNYTYFEDMLKREIKRSNRNDLTFSLLMIDLDDLNFINDFYGHEAGDRILKKFAHILKCNLRKSDCYARYAGDEFIVLLPETGILKAQKVAEKIRRKTTRIRLFGFDKKQMVSASVGMALYPVSAATASSIVKSADLAMANAKQNGKNQTCVYDPSLLSSISLDRNKIERFAQDADLSTIQSLVTAVDLKDNYTQQHSSEVSRLSVCLAQALGLSEDELEKLRIAGLLHDIGKIGVADNILLKQGPLDDDEYQVIKKHPIFGVNILKHSNHFQEALPLVKHHHERFDGKGYPDGLKKDNIPYMARILFVADSYHAMTSDRPYRKGLSKRQALQEIQRCSGSQFDPKMVDVFTNIIPRLETDNLSLTPAQ